MYKICLKFHNKHVARYLEGIDVLKFEKFHLLLTLLFYFFTIFYHSQFK